MSVFLNSNWIWLVWLVSRIFCRRDISIRFCLVSTTKPNPLPMLTWVISVVKIETNFPDRQILAHDYAICDKTHYMKQRSALWENKMWLFLHVFKTKHENFLKVSENRRVLAFFCWNFVQVWHTSIKVNYFSNRDYTL